MKKSFVFLIVMVIIAGSNADAQHPRYGSMIRFADSTKFFIGGFTPFDKWNWWDSTQLLNFPPAGDYYDLSHFYRYVDNEPLVILGLNSETRGTFDEIDSNGIFDDHSAPDSIVLGDTAEKSMNVLFTNGTNMNDMIENSYLMRFELERHSASYANTRQYAGFLSHSGHTCSNTIHAQSTTPPWLIGTVDASDLSYNALHVTKGTDIPGVLADSFYHRSFLATLGSGDNQPAHYWAWPGVPVDRKMLCRIRVRVDSLSWLDALDYLFANKDSLFTLTIVQDSVSGGSSIDSTRLIATILADTSLFHHRGTGYDTIDLHWTARKNSNNTYFQFYWQGNCSLTFDYMEVMTDTFPSDTSAANYEIVQSQQNYNNWQYSRYRSYNGLTMHNDSTLRLMAGEYVHKYDSLVDFFYMPEEKRLGSMAILKRFAKLVRDSSHGHIECVMTMHDSLEQNSLDTTGLNGNFYGNGLPMQYDYYLEGVHHGWLDSSLYADPRYFLVGEYFDYHVPLPRRRPPYLPMSDSSWDSTYAINGHDMTTLYRNINPYSPTNYSANAQRIIRFLINDYRNARDVSQRASEPNFKHKFIAMWEGGVTPSIQTDSSIPGGQYLWGGGGLRAITAPEMKVLAHLAISSGASALYMYQPYTVTPNQGINGGIMRLTDGFHGSNYYTDSLWNGSAPYLDSEWIGWKENYDTVLHLIPELKLYGAQLGNCRYIADYLSNEAYSAPSIAGVPFLPHSIRAINDSDVRDDTSSSAPLNKTFVHVSAWVDTTVTTDTFLYITNARTDDSYDSTVRQRLDTVADSIPPGTFDRRYITMQMKARHLVTDVADTLGLQTMGKVRTPYVGAGDSLVVWLLPGDGVLVRLTGAPDSMQQMRVQLNYPKAPPAVGPTQNDYNHGSIKFSDKVYGVSPADSTIPSSLYSFVGIKNSQAPTLHQDSLLYQKFDVQRMEKWRHQNWENGLGSSVFKFKDSLSTISGPLAQRTRQLGTDSIAYHFSITTDLESTNDSGNFRFQDPFYVNGSYNNQSGFANRMSPFILDDNISGFPYASDSQHYGGVFLNQNRSFVPTTPNYGINAYLKLANNTLAGSDTIPGWTDWSFLGWWRNDSLLGTTSDSNTWLPYCTSQNPQIVILKDSAQYIARYKEHSVAFPSPNINDSGYSYNNQRKFVYIGPDATGKMWYRNVYASGGRIYTALGYHWADTSSWMNWQPEELVSDWNNPRAGFPALVMHKTAIDTIFTFVYQQMLDTVNGKWGIMHAYKDSNGHYVSERVDSTGNAISESTPAMARFDAPMVPTMMCDAVAWTESDGIHVKGLGLFSRGRIIGMSSEKIYSNSTAINPTIWAGDSNATQIIAGGFVVAWTTATPFWIAWQQKHYTPIPLGRPIGVDSVWDILSQKLQLGAFGVFVPFPIAIRLDTIAGEPVDTVSETVWPQSYDNMRPCLSGLNSSDTCMVMIAYEANGFNLSGSNFQGVSVAKKLSPGTAWQRSAHFQIFWPTDRYLRPSIEVTKYRLDTVRTDYYFSLAFQNNYAGVYHFAMNDSTQRVTGVFYEHLNSPQLSVDPDGQDSNVERMALGGGTEPQWLIHQNYGAFKMGIDHNTLCAYRQVSERDDSDMLYVVHGMGELNVDNGESVTPLDLIDRPDSVGIDSVHPAAWHMRTENFTLPATGSFFWTPWLSTSCDSLYFEHHRAAVHCYLDFFDTTGVFLTRLDSLSIDDSDRSIGPSIRQITLSSSSPARGYVAMTRTTGAILDSGAEVQDIITMKRLSANKLANGAGIMTASADSVPILTNPDPFRDYTTIAFALPEAGPVTISIMDMLGHQVATLSQTGDLHAGEHQLEWHPNNLPSGVYTIMLTFGNIISSARVVYMR